MRSFPAFFLALIIVVSFNCGEKQKEEKSESIKKVETANEKFDPSRNADRDIQAAISEASNTGKRIILDVGGEWCIWCHRLDKFFADNKDVDDFMRSNFVVVKINYSPENKNEKVLSRYPEIPGYPHLFVLDSDGTFLHSQGTGDLEKDKGHDREKVLAFLTEWAPKDRVSGS